MPGRKKGLTKDGYPVRLYGKDEATALLKDYTKIELSSVPKLPRGCGIRYYTNAGVFKYGGYIRDAMFEGRSRYENNEVVSTKYIKLQGSKFGGSFLWMISYDSISSIYRENDELDAVRDATGDLSDVVTNMKEVVVTSADRINILESTVSDLLMRFADLSSEFRIMNREVIRLRTIALKNNGGRLTSLLNSESGSEVSTDLNNVGSEWSWQSSLLVEGT